LPEHYRYSLLPRNVDLQATARRDAKGVWLLDCWPVHTSAEFREWVARECPGFELMYIPYGRTGDYQINDTHYHKPLKGVQADSAAAWHLKKLMDFRAQVKAGLIDDATVLKRMSEVLRLRHLREQSPVWLRRGVDALIAVNPETGMNLLRKGWVSCKLCTSNWYVYSTYASLLLGRSTFTSTR